MNARIETSPHTESFINLVGDLQANVKTLIRKEIELAKAEMGEKVSALGHNAILAAAGGVLALMAAFLLLLGLGAIIAHLLQKADMAPATAYSLAYAGLGLILGGAGYGLIRKAVQAFSKISFTPEKALASARAADALPIQIRKNGKAEKPPKASSADLQHEVIAARVRMDNEVNELRSRLTPGYMAKSFFAGLRHHPVGVLIVSAASTGIGGFFYWRKQQHLQALKRHTSAARHWWNLGAHRA